MVVRTDVQKALRRCAHDDDLGKVEKGGERCGVPFTKARVEGPSRFVGDCLETLRQVCLEDVTGEDVFAHASDRIKVTRARKRRINLEGTSHQTRSTRCEGARVRRCEGAGVRGSEGPGTVVPIRSLINAAREAARAIRAASDVSGMPVETIHAREDS